MRWEKETRKGEVIAHRCTIGDLRINVHHHIDYGPEQWLLSVYPELLPPSQRLESKDPDAAKAEALGRVRQWLKQHLTPLEKST
jgi:hypothetical protein